MKQVFGVICMIIAVLILPFLWGTMDYIPIEYSIVMMIAMLILGFIGAWCLGGFTSENDHKPIWYVDHTKIDVNE
ncbi:MAG: hypothetical protein AAGA35_04185 [Patescibacteria group bacterium]